MNVKKSNPEDAHSQVERNEDLRLGELVSDINHHNRCRKTMTGSAQGRGLLSVLKGLTTLEEDFPQIEDPPPGPLPEMEK